MSHNTSCPVCGRPIDDTMRLIGQVRICFGKCVRRWFAKHDRRVSVKSVPFGYDRRVE
jgi:hypothetical protein